MSNSNFSRRDFLFLAGGALAASAMPFGVQAGSPAQSRTIAMNNIHTGEQLESCYFDGREYISSELIRLDEICRDYRREEVHPMDKRLFDQLSKIQNLLGVETEVMMISGYRSPVTNAALRAKSSGVAKKSYHMTGQALDFNLEGVSLAKVRDAAAELKMGGVGYYPRSNFIHIDTGPVRRW